MALYVFRRAFAALLVVVALVPSTVTADAPSGRTLAWGANDAAQLGGGPGPGTLSPGVLSIDSHIKAVAAGANHTIALLDDGTVWAWGQNDRGQLGYAPSAPDERGDATGLPVQVPYLSGIVAVAAGDQHSLALDADGVVWAWGANSWGQLGNGHPNPGDFDCSSGGFGRIDTGGCGADFDQPAPVAVAGLSGVTAIAAGGNHSLALLWDGTVRQWGMDPTVWGADWLHGDPVLLKGVVPLPTPVFVHGFESIDQVSDVRAIAAGGGHSLALTRDGSVYAWGADESGQLGDVETDPGCPCRFSAARVPGLSDVAAVAAGQRHSLALSHDLVFAWGANDRGQLGNGTLSGTARPTLVSGIPGAGPDGGGLGATLPTALAAGLNHSLAVVNAVVESPTLHCGTFGDRCQHMLYAWGANDAGQLGDGGMADSLTAELVNHVRGVSQVAAGEHHTLALNGEIFSLPIFASDPTHEPEVVRSGLVPPEIDASGPSSGTKLSLDRPARTPTPTSTPVGQHDAAPTATPTLTPAALSASSPTPTPSGSSSPTPTPGASSPTPTPSAGPTQPAAVATATPTRTPTATPTQLTVIIVIPSPTPTPTLSPIR